MNDTAADLQMEFDQAVYRFGPDSHQAIEAQKAAQLFFKNMRVNEPRLYPQPSSLKTLNFTGTQNENSINDPKLIPQTI